MGALFTDGQLGSLKLTNRIAVSPMCQYVAKQGNANSWHTIHLGSLALSGAAAVFIEATAVEAVGRITPGDLGLWDDATEWHCAERFLQCETYQRRHWYYNLRTPVAKARVKCPGRVES
jgi:2,4-dienoyl-CoA reductase-like NADH-dependent reductase (Old Yellow Enzyme family)